MLIKSDFEVPRPVDEVWGFFQDIPGVAACLPGAEIDEQVGPDRYTGKVAVRMGPVKMRFAGQAHVKERDEATRTIVMDAAGADERGRGQAAMGVTARLVPTTTGTRVEVEQDLQLSGAAAQYGRGMIADVTAVMMRDFSANMQARLDALGRGVSADEIEASKPASGLAIGFQAMLMALKRVAARFFLPYQPDRS
jgi:hypothetical protein